MDTAAADAAVAAAVDESTEFAAVELRSKPELAADGSEGPLTSLALVPTLRECFGGLLSSALV